MSTRKIIKIDEELCDGCGQCVPGCAEGALQIIDGKARLVSEVYCDGLGACLGECPSGALTLVEQEAEDFDEEAVREHLAKLERKVEPGTAHSHHREKLACGCPGSMAQALQREDACCEDTDDTDGVQLHSKLSNWPVQIHLVPIQAPYLQDARLLIAADCVPFAFADFHRRFVLDRIVLIGCPKLDDANAYVAKLTEMFKHNNLRDIEVLHMEVPCCSGLIQIVKMALEASGKDIPVKFTQISIRGEVMAPAFR